MKDANNTYNTLSGFQSDVQQSSQKAELALQTEGSISNEIDHASNLIYQAGEALEGANKNANDAKTNAQEAKEKYALQASKVRHPRLSFLSHQLHISYLISYIGC